MSATGIQWTDHSINPIRARDRKTGAIGHYCEKISSGCANCYASSLQKRFQMPAFPGKSRLEKLPIGHGGCVTINDQIEVFLDESKLDEVRRRKKPTKYFWCDMTDMFGSWVPDSWLDKIFETMEAAGQHTHQVLTKRVERMAEYVGWRWGPREDCQGHRIPCRNIHLGASVENQTQANHRISHLLNTPAAVRFLSVEPLLESTDLGLRNWCIKDWSGAKLHWIIVGGESGNNARPCEVNWIRFIIEDCKLAGVPVFVKQLGAFPRFDRDEAELFIRDIKGGDWDEWPDGLRVREFPEPIT